MRVMKAELILPIESLRGTLRGDGYYFRVVNGQQIVQKCPKRKPYKPTAGEVRGQELFTVRTRFVNRMIKEGTMLTRKEIWERIMRGELVVNN